MRFSPSLAEASQPNAENGVDFSFHDLISSLLGSNMGVRVSIIYLCNVASRKTKFCDSAPKGEHWRILGPRSFIPPSSSCRLTTTDTEAQSLWVGPVT